MTRDEFYENYYTYGNLIDFCEEYGLDCMNDVFYQDDLSSMIDDDITDAIRSWEWYDVRDALNDIDEDSEWYRRDGILDYVTLNDYDDLDEYREAVAFAAEEAGFLNDYDEEDDVDDVYALHVETATPELAEEEPLELDALLASAAV